MKTNISDLIRTGPADYDYLYVTRVDSNVKGLNKVYEFKTPTVVFSGLNGSGKTSLQNAITLAIFGEIFEAGARESAKAWALLQHLLPAGQPLLYSRVTFSDGSQCSYVAGPDQKPVHTPPPFPTAAPFDATVSALRGSTETVIDFLHTHFGEASENAALFLPMVPGTGKNPFAHTFADEPLSSRRILRKNLAKAKAAAWAKEVRVFQSILDRVGNGASDELLREIRVELKRAEANAKLCKLWEKAYNDALVKWFNANKGRIERLVSAKAFGVPVRFVWDGAKLFVTLDGRTFTSGAETVALAVAFISAAPRAARYNLVMLPDRLVDDETAAGILTALSKAEHLNAFMPRLEHLDENDETVEFFRYPFVEYPGEE
jgi:hypothetical protein